MSDDRHIASPWDSDPVHAEAFYSFVQWAIGNAEFVAQYRNDTGDNYQPAATTADRMIDSATGRDFAFAQAFTGWCLTLYGTPEQIFGDAK